MSDAALTDSTTPKGSSCVSGVPTSGNSRYVMSPNSFCAKSVRPTVAMSPSSRTHSCVLVNRKSFGAAMLPCSFQVKWRSKSRLSIVPLVERYFYLYSAHGPASNYDLERLAHSSDIAVHERKPDIL